MSDRPPLHLAFFNRSFPPETAATGQLLMELCEDLVHDYRCAVSVIAGPPLIPDGQGPPEGGRLFRKDSHTGIQVFRTFGTTFRPHRFPARAMNYMSYFLFACLRGLRVPPPDVVVSLTDPPIIGLAALMTARRCGAKFVFLCQDIFPEVARLLDDFHNERVNRVLDQINRFLIRQADRVVALGETMRERLIVGKGADPQKVTVIHNWADSSEIMPGPKRNPFSLAHGLADKFVIMHSGNMGLSQELETVIRAAERLSRFPEIQIVFVGDGVKKPFLEELVRSLRCENVRFLPYQPKEGLRDSFASADLFVVSLKRGLAGYIVPSKLYGILAAGRPYVAAVEEECEVAAITKKYDCGYVAEPGNPDDLVTKILALYHNRALVQRLGANARQAALNFDRRLQVQAYYTLFCELIHVQPSAS